MRRRSPLPTLIFFALSACLVAACSFAPPEPPASPTPIASAPTATAEPAPPLTLPACSFGQGRAPQVASYCMNARLDPDAKTVIGIERITYRNPSQDTLTELWLRLYLRAFRDFNTTWMRESRGQMRWFFDDYMNGSGVIDYAVDRNDGRTVTVTRAGTVRAPVEIGVTLASGARLLKTWDGQTPSASFTFPPGDPVKKVEIDPEHKLKAEVNRVNNTSAAP